MIAASPPNAVAVSNDIVLVSSLYGAQCFGSFPMGLYSLAATLRRVECNGLDRVKLGRLHALLAGEDYSPTLMTRRTWGPLPSHTDARQRRLNELLRHERDETVIVALLEKYGARTPVALSQFPPRFVHLLAELPANRQAAVAGEWAGIDEFHPTAVIQADLGEMAQDWLKQLVQLAVLAGRRGKHLFLWERLMA